MTTATVTRIYNDILTLSQQYQIKKNTIITIEMYRHDEEIAQQVLILVKELGVCLKQAKKENVSLPSIEQFYNEMVTSIQQGGGK